MNFLNSNRCFALKSCNLLSTSQFSGRDTQTHTICYGNTKLFCRSEFQNQTKKSRKGGNFKKSDKNLVPIPYKNDGEDENKNSLEVETTSVLVPTRNAVLQACTVTCGLIGALGLLIRQVSHMAAIEGLPVADSYADITFGLETWHLGLIMGSVILVSSSRFLLLNIWPDFAESSEKANQQVLTSLEPLDYLIVSFLPGISEELLFRGSLLPLFGVNWTSVFAVSALFGVLHLGSGRNYSFAIWATFVGVVYGYMTVLSSSMTVAMATHALNNLVGGIIWRYSSKHTD